MPYGSIIDEVQKHYVKYRRTGISRVAALQQIRSDYSCELQDSDDRLPVLLGMFLALCKKHELLEFVAFETLDAIRTLEQKDVSSPVYKLLPYVIRCAKDKTMYGEEAYYPKKTPYIPNWQIGDAFLHTMKYPTSEALGIKDWSIILYKFGEYIDSFETTRQLMLVCLAPPNQIPTSYDDLVKLGFLPMMKMGERTEYVAQISVTSKKDEQGYGLTHIGCFPLISASGLGNYTQENPLTAMPLFGKMKSTDEFPAFEDQICRIYKRLRRKT